MIPSTVTNIGQCSERERSREKSYRAARFRRCSWRRHICSFHHRPFTRSSLANHWAIENRWAEYSTTLLLPTRPNVLNRSITVTPVSSSKQTFDQFTGHFDIFLARHEDENISWNGKNLFECLHDALHRHGTYHLQLRDRSESIVSTQHRHNLPLKLCWRTVRRETRV